VAVVSSPTTSSVPSAAVTPPFERLEGVVFDIFDFSNKMFKKDILQEKKRDRNSGLEHNQTFSPLFLLPEGMPLLLCSGSEKKEESNLFFSTPITS